MAMQGYVWLCMAMQDYAGLCMAMQGCVGLCRAMQRCVGLCRAMQGCVGLFRAMYGYVGSCCAAMQMQAYVVQRCEQLWLHHELTYLGSISAVSRGMSAGSFSRIAAGNRAYVILSNGKSPRLPRQQACNEHNIEVVNRHQGRWASRKIDRVPGVPIIKMTTFQEAARPNL